MADWQVVSDRLDMARAELGIRRQVRVFSRRYTRGFAGRYIGLVHGIHHVGILTTLHPEAANETLWHELGHVEQTERLGSPTKFHQAWLAQARELGVDLRDLRAGTVSWKAYAQIPFEIEANAVKARYAERNRIIIPVEQRAAA